MHKDAKTQDLHSNEKIIDNLLKCLSYEITRNFTLLQKNWNCPFAEQTLNVCIIWNISLAVLSDKMTAQTMKRQKFFQTHPILILLLNISWWIVMTKNIFWLLFIFFLVKSWVYTDVRKSLPEYVYTCLVFRSTKTLSEMRPWKFIITLLTEYQNHF